VGLGNWFSHKAAPLTGAPAIRRTKTYSAQTGYVYRYYYEGHRPFRAGASGGVEYVFRVAAGGRDGDTAVRVPGAAIRAWEEAHSRQLSSTERYAIAKMALFQAFDERPTPAGMSQGINVRAADIETIVETLGA
jgi:hypothetical protein